MTEISEKEIEAAMSEWHRALIDAPNESVYERRRRCIHAALSAAARVRAEDNAREPAMNARKALNSMVEALEKMGFVILSRSEVGAIRDKALEEAAAMCEEPRRFNDGSEIVMPSGKAYASAIRALKSGGSQPR